MALFASFPEVAAGGLLATPHALSLRAKADGKDFVAAGQRLESRIPSGCRNQNDDFSPTAAPSALKDWPFPLFL